MHINRLTNEVVADSKDDDIIIVCTPTIFPKGIDGAIEGKCSECSCGVWLSPTTVNHLKDSPNSKLACIMCMQKNHGDEPTNSIGVLKGAMQELKEQIERDRRKQS